MEIIFLFISAISNAMSAWSNTLTLWGYGPKTAPIASGASQTQSASDMPGSGVVINAENIILVNGSVSLTSGSDLETPERDSETNPAEDPARDETK
ncbi:MULTISPECIES: hypothetical protein [Actinotignum]|uniref:Uncharacterized protein n=1 Tax=Actinotignum schaalii FB123-CNA-2 TaxID=883067 RepID=S2VKD9_9ACTO|nr:MULTISPECIES: hypothetical protein [Actinotignum]EPD27261.1 hypothetical protein HMPREF9237_00618 [Actinotignum schaalii FB123-CNA-2]MDY5126815.1 hypothetical protein [Actinotignum sp. SLA_B059]MDY5136355.1 hypothetical protein [Actinotignum sanguinis]MDY5138995.1 hypothetical protein [Actinotignum timonense]